MTGGAEPRRQALFVDTGAWVAVTDSSDQFHRRAAPFYRDAFNIYQRLVTTDLVLAKYADHDLSLTDAVSFAVMQDLRLTEAFGFDRHFTVAGFLLVPGAEG